MLKVLTVGDGDLTLSLALARAYGNHIQLTASVLDTQESLLKAFPDAPLTELESLKIPVMYGLDATKLHREYAKNSWDLILFHHPHLGLATLEKNEAEHANRHYRLLCHYLHSAGLVSSNGLVHVCLCGTQPETWRLHEAAQHQGMTLVRTISTAAPFSQIWRTTATTADDDDVDNDLEEAPAQAQFAAPRRYRNGKLGSRHFLGKYGYKHRRTAGAAYNGIASDMKVAGSMHFVFQASTTSPPAMMDPTLLSPHTCTICRATFPCETELNDHLLSPAQPQVAQMTNAARVSQKKERSEGSTLDTISQKRGQHPPMLSEPSDDKTASPSDQNAIRNNPSFQSTTVHPTSSKTLSTSGYYQELVVSTECNGKRLRWFIKHNIPGLSKRQAESSIQEGLVRVNGTAALDSSRILITGNAVVVLEQKKSPTGPALEIVHRSQPPSSLSLLVVWKPSGLRTKGKFPGTLEYTLSEQEGVSYSSMSKLETSCPGLCVATQEGVPTQQIPLSIRHVLTALVHGRVPEDWLPRRQVAISIIAKWKKKKQKHNHDDSIEEEQQQETIELVPLERTKDLSTVSIVIAGTPSASSLCRFFRQEGYPVVGDHHCRQEYMTLKRSIRNRIKDKLCIGCYQVELDVDNNGNETNVQKEIPTKLSAEYWETNFGNKDLPPTQDNQDGKANETATY
jgi:hypothetical protein